MASTAVASYTGVLPPLVSATNQFQNYYMLNKVVLDVTSIDVPYIALAKREEERKERFFRQALVFAFVFCIVSLFLVCKLLNIFIKHLFKIETINSAYSTLQDGMLHPTAMLLNSYISLGLIASKDLIS